MTTDSEKTPEVNMDWLLDALHDYYRHLLSPFDLVILVKKRFQAEREKVKGLVEAAKEIASDSMMKCHEQSKKFDNETLSHWSDVGHGNLHKLNEALKAFQEGGRV